VKLVLVYWWERYEGPSFFLLNKKQERRIIKKKRIMTTIDGERKEKRNRVSFYPNKKRNFYFFGKEYLLCESEICVYLGFEF
jgi:hypothetical protein